MVRVSIITPSYKNKLDEVQRTMMSVRNQSSPEYEWIVVHDGSTFPFTAAGDKVLSLGENYGPSVARNIGFQVADGDIITYVDMGDELNPERVEHLINMFESHTIEMCFDAYYIVQGEYKRLYSPAGFQQNGYDIRKMLDIGNVSTPLGVSHTRKPFVDVGGFQRGIVCGEDGILWRRMKDIIPQDKIMLTDFIAGTYYVEPDSQARTQRRFDMGGFAFDAGNEQGSHGQSLDEDWFLTYNSKELFDVHNS